MSSPHPISRRRASLFQALSFTFLLAGSFIPDATLSAAIVTWDGGAVNNNWTSARNWQGDTAPAANDTLVFDGFARLTPSNDFLANTGFAGLTFAPTAGAFTLTGNSLTLRGDIANQTAVLT